MRKYRNNTQTHVHKESLRKGCEESTSVRAHKRNNGSYVVDVIGHGFVVSGDCFLKLLGEAHGFGRLLYLQPVKGEERC